MSRLVYPARGLGSSRLSFQGIAMVRVILGGIFIVGGLTGKLVLLGTHSGPALAVVGAIMVVVGPLQVSRQ
jgi:hypothetical protein